MNVKSVNICSIIKQHLDGIRVSMSSTPMPRSELLAVGHIYFNNKRIVSVFSLIAAFRNESRYF